MEKGSTINTLETRRRKPPTLALVLAMLTLVGLGAAGVYLVTLKPTETPAEDWISFTSDDGKFELKLPEAPKASERQYEDGGDPIHMLTVEMRSRVYWVAWSDYSDDQIEEFGTEMLLSYAAENGIQAIEGVITRRIDLTWESHPGLEFWADLPGGKAHFRVLLVGNRMYRQAIIRSPDFEPNDELFFGSFVLK